MAIVSTPTDARIGQTVQCVICGRATPLACATAGLVDASGKQAFACSGHFWDGAKFILGWILFTIEQRRALELTALEMDYGSLGGRPLY
jgi:hypothetical protein